jgi:predicted nucleic acid-binding protein
VQYDTVSTTSDLASSIARRTVVLDTNVVFGWLLFADADCAPVGGAVQRGAVRWIATPEMRVEHFHVLGRGSLDHFQPDKLLLASAWERHCTMVDLLPLSMDAGRLRCTDPDDQKFIQLALGHRVRWLLSKDRAVLKLGRRMRPFGIEVLTPSDWALRNQSVPDTG